MASTSNPLGAIALNQGSGWEDLEITGQNQILSNTRLSSIINSLTMYAAAGENILNGGGLQSGLAGKGGLFQSIGFQFPTATTLTMTVDDNSAVLWGTTSIFGGFVSGRSVSGSIDAAPPAFFNTNVSEVTSVPFENNSGTTYYVGLTISMRPVTAAANPITGTFEYTAEEAALGVRLIPATVVDTGTQLQFDIPVNNLTSTRSLAGRTCYVWKEDPEAVTGTAIVAGVVTWSGSANQVTVSYLGQSTPSTTASDYRLFLTGPVITDIVGLSSIAGVAYLGEILGAASPTADTRAQVQLPQLYRLRQTLLEQTGPGNDGFRFKIRARPDSGATASEPQISSDNVSGTRIFQVQANGTVVFGDSGEATSTIARLLSSAARWDIQTDASGHMTLVHNGGGTLNFDVSSSGAGDVQIRWEGQDLQAYGAGAMRFDDDNTGSPIPLSDAGATALPAGAASILDALGGTVASFDAVITRGVASDAGASDVTQPSGTDVTMAQMDLAYNGLVKTIATDTVTVSTVDGTYYVYFDTATESYAVTTALGTAFNTDDIPMAVVEIAGAAVDYFMPVAIYVQQQPDNEILVTPVGDNRGNFKSAPSAALWLGLRSDAGLYQPKQMRLRGSHVLTESIELDNRHNGLRIVGDTNGSGTQLSGTAIDFPVFSIESGLALVKDIEIDGVGFTGTAATTPHSNEVGFVRAFGGNGFFGLRIRNCVCDWGAASGDPNNFIYIEDAFALTGIRIENNAFKGSRARDNGIYIAGRVTNDISDTVIVGNTMQGATTGTIGSPAAPGGIALINTSGFSSDGVVIDSNTIDGFVGYGITVQAAQNVRIDNNRIAGLLTSGTDRSGISLDHSGTVYPQDTKVRWNKVDATSLTGAALGIELDSGSHRILVEGNKIAMPDETDVIGISALADHGISVIDNDIEQTAGTTNSGQQGIAAGGSGAGATDRATVIRGNRVTGFRVNNATRGVITLGDGGAQLAGGRVENNNIRDFFQSNGIFLAAGSNLAMVLDNVIEFDTGSSGGTGIDLNEQEDVLCKGNQINRTTNSGVDKGIDATNCLGCVVEGNVLHATDSGTTGTAIEASGAASCIFSGNIMRYWEYGFEVNTSATDENVFMGNIIRDVDRGMYLNGGENVILGNHMKAPDTALLISAGDANTVVGNRMESTGTGASDDGIALSNALSDNNVIVGNSAAANTGNAIDTNATSGGNNVSANFGSAISTDAGDTTDGSNIT